MLLLLELPLSHSDMNMVWDSVPAAEQIAYALVPVSPNSVAWRRFTSECGQTTLDLRGGTAPFAEFLNSSINGQSRERG